MNRETLLKYEPKLAKLFTNSKEMDRLAGAYLLYGVRNAPLKECAIYLAKSLNCQNDTLACGQCPACRRFDQRVNTDFHLIDGESKMIKREDIEKLEDKFSKSSFEKNHRLSYVIHRIENTNATSCNALLKFLEEPKEGQIAFLTSYNIERVLPTILSRCITIRVDPIDPNSFKEELLKKEYKKKGARLPLQLSEGGAYILSKLFSDFDEVETLLTSDDSFITGYRMAEEYLIGITSNIRTANFSLLLQIERNKDNKCYNWMYLTLNEIFTLALLGEDCSDNPFRESIELLRRYPKNTAKAENIIKETLAYRQLNFNPTLVFAKIALALEEVRI